MLTPASPNAGFTVVQALAPTIPASFAFHDGELTVVQALAPTIPATTYGAWQLAAAQVPISGC